MTTYTKTLFVFKADTQDQEDNIAELHDTHLGKVESSFISYRALPNESPQSLVYKRMYLLRDAAIALHADTMVYVAHNLGESVTLKLKEMADKASFAFFEDGFNQKLRDAMSRAAA